MLRPERLSTAASFVAAMLVVAACTGSGAGTATATPQASAISGGGGRGGYDYNDAVVPSAEASVLAVPQAHEVNVANGSVGAYLTGDAGLTLYTFKPDSKDTSTCTDACAQAWPPFTTTSEDSVGGGDGVTGTLSTFERPDGKLQVAYDGAPLYYFSNDTQPGDTNGQGMGGNWFVAAP
jgi:predicted lipoprotein with Yx(FWY)xxD motif